MTKYAPLALPSDSLKVQLDNKELWNEARSIHEADFYTFGYSGRRVGELLAILKEAGVRSVADIRYSPVSMYSPDFSKERLRERLQRSRVRYVHLPKLGVPRDIRVKAIETGSRVSIWEWYDGHVVAPFVQNMEEFFNAVDHPVAFMCVEIDPSACHRHRLFQALEDRGLRGFDL